MHDQNVVQQIAATAARLAELTELLASRPDGAGCNRYASYPEEGEDGRHQNDLLTVARLWVRARAAKEAHFDLDLFHDPAWNMLLDLYISLRDRRLVSVTSACIASGAPMTTALRWISVLQERALIERAADPRDNRRAHILLSADGIARIEATLARFLTDDRSSTAWTPPPLRAAN